MKFLHTSDWHLGRTLYGRKRYDEFSAFLDWLLQTIKHEEIDALLIAGDVFDSTTPSNRAQELYYRFLHRVSASCCRHVVVIAGNHDSPTFLNAPRELLKAMSVHVVGSISESLEDEVIVLSDKPNNSQSDTGDEGAIVCAVPYLRDRDIRVVEPGETIDDKNRKLVEGVRRHYADVVSIAESRRAAKRIPVIAMGHLFTAGGKTVDSDGVRELYVGSLAHVEEDVFPSSIDYLALGHLHIPQTAAGKECIRYSGSPLPMGFGEADQQKQVTLVEFNELTPAIRHIPIPCFQELVRISGSLNEIYAELETLKKDESSAWLEIEYTGQEVVGNLQELLQEEVAGSDMEIRRIINRQIIDRVIGRSKEQESLDDLSVDDVFNRCLDAFDVPAEDREELTASYHDIITDLHDEDLKAD